LGEPPRTVPEPEVGSDRVNRVFSGRRRAGNLRPSLLTSMIRTTPRHRCYIALALAWTVAARADEQRSSGEAPAPSPTPEAIAAPAAQPPLPPTPEGAAPAEAPTAPAEASSAATPAPRPDDVFSGKPAPDAGSGEHSWFDEGHAAVGRIFFAPVVRLDRFFSDETDLDPERARSFARLRSAVRLREDGKPQTSIDLVADIKFPGVNRWLDRARLVISGEGDTNEDPTVPSGSTSPFTSRPRGLTRLELRFGAWDAVRAHVDVGAGLLFRLPVGAFARVRYRQAVPIADLLVARFSTQGFWRTDTLFGSRVSAELDWPIGKSSVARLGGASQVAQRKTRGIEYGSALTFSHAFSPTVAVALGVDAQGSVRDPVTFQKYRAFTRLRHDVLRRWIFVEAEPEIGWPWTPERGRYRALAVTLRLELQFEGAGAAEAAAERRPPPG
jgi:hypothetical protein